MNIRTQPLLSVIIPTHNRPQYLPRAVKSALHAAPDGNVEVIVVPNGGDQSWRKSLFNYLNNSRVIISPIEVGNANAARNHGLSLAEGEYIRFLDDDDFFLNEAADQLAFMIENNIEICTGYISHYTEDLGILNQVSISDIDGDFVQSCIPASGLTLVHASIYLKSCLDNIFWDENVPWLQDNIWVLSLAIKKDWKWSYFHKNVGVWVHHSNVRVSLFGSLKPSPWIVDKLIILLRVLIRDNRLTSLRAEKIIFRLREYAHINFPNSPIYCHNLILSLPELSDQAGVNYQSLKMKGVILEWFMLPYRFLKNKLRNLKPLFNKSGIRKL